MSGTADRSVVMHVRLKVSESEREQIRAAAAQPGWDVSTWATINLVQLSEIELGITSDYPPPRSEGDLPEHLRDDAPYVVCSVCGRRSWQPDGEGKPCRMPQPDGSRCSGTFKHPGLRPGEDG